MIRGYPQAPAAIPPDKTPGTHWIGSWLGPSPSLDVLGEDVSFLITYPIINSKHSTICFDLSSLWYLSRYSEDVRGSGFNSWPRLNSSLLPSIQTGWVDNLSSYSLGNTDCSTGVKRPECEGHFLPKALNGAIVPSPNTELPTWSSVTAAQWPIFKPNILLSTMYVALSKWQDRVSDPHKTAAGKINFVRLMITLENRWLE
jgi:hypothetical protein